MAFLFRFTFKIPQNSKYPQNRHPPMSAFLFPALPGKPSKQITRGSPSWKAYPLLQIPKLFRVCFENPRFPWQTPFLVEGRPHTLEKGRVFGGYGGRAKKPEGLAIGLWTRFVCLGPKELPTQPSDGTPKLWLAKSRF